ncbi:hypothetical protein [Martelella sp. HB161492]|uniref:hypothetical protein n=1 Tax=Martelella sp. HB161492 TaxID=2720726 RepID=UPI00158FD962|nr:hypothetical protein [Martelella sp. HB161492]
MTDNQDRMRVAVEAIWIGCGETPPSGQALETAAVSLAGALKAGSKIPRVLDKTLSPLVGPRRDLDP